MGSAFGMLKMASGPADPRFQKAPKIAGINRLTVLVLMVPLTNFGHTSLVPEPLRLLSGIFQALLNLNAIVRPDQLAQDDGVTNGRVEGLMPPSLGVIDIFANDSPVLLDEGGLSQKSIGVLKTIENESGFCVSSSAPMIQQRSSKPVSPLPRSL